METELHEMYMALPLPGQAPIYIPGYTEALSYVPGVRVIPDHSYYADVPYLYRQFFTPVEYPAYYIPVNVGRKHYGFILKGQGKMSSRYSSYFPFFNLDAFLRPEPYVVVVEGIKDAGIFLERNIPVMAMLTSGMSEASASVFDLFSKVPIFVQDGDQAGDKGVSQYKRKHPTSPMYRVRPFGHKDMGDYYDKPQLRPFVEATYSKVTNIIGVLNSQSFGFHINTGAKSWQ